MEKADFVVIGGGIAGASAAFELATHGQVVLLEKEDTLGYHTTGRSAAMFTEAYESGIVRRLTMASRAFLEKPPDGFSPDPLLRPLALLFLGRSSQRIEIEALAAEVGHLGPPVEVLERDAVLELCPILDASYVGSGVLEPHAKEIDVHALHQGFVAGARGRGTHIESGSEASVIEQATGGWTVGSFRERWETPVVVNAAGAWCDEVGVLAGARPLGLQPMRRTAFTFPPPEGLDPQGLPFVNDVDEQWYFKPEGIGFLGSLSEETPMPPHDVRHTERDVALAVSRITDAVTFEIPVVRNAWAGLRSFVGDRVPVVGEDPEQRGFYWLAGQGGFGIMTSPAMALAITGLVVEGRLPTPLQEQGLRAEDLSPARLR